MNLPQDIGTPDAQLVMPRLFSPRAVAVVGVPRGMKTGRVFLEALQKPGFAGPIYPVNPNADEILGLRAYPSVSAIGEPVDLAIIVTPPDAAAGVIADCGRAGVAAAVLFTAGFDELATPEGDARAEQVRRAAREAGVRLVGPNCMGIYSPAVGVAPFPNMPAEAGDVGYISQSGSLLSSFAREATVRGFALSKGVSVGNQLDLQAADFLRYLGQDPDTAVIAMYVEGAPDGRAFFEALREAARRKPVVLWKAGRTAGGARAVRSHTGALAGSQQVWEAAARQGGAILARTIEEMTDLVVALRMRPAPAGSRMAVVTGPGGPSISAVDALEEAGLELAVPDEQTVERLRAEIGAVGTSPRNPVDVGLIMYGPTDVYSKVTGIIGADAAVDGVVVIGGGAGGGAASAQQWLAVHEQSGKPLAHVSARPVPDGDGLRSLVDAGIGLFPTAERAVRAFAGVGRYAALRREIEAESTP